MMREKDFYKVEVRGMDFFNFNFEIKFCIMEDNE